MGWLEFVAAYAVFFASHSLPVRPSVRPWLEARLGSSGFTLAYSALSLVVLAWLIGAAGRAPHLAVWDWAPWQVHVPLTVMWPVCLILALSIARPNPFSFGGASNDRFDPTRPGIVRWSRHPLLLALALWAAAHIVPNGDLAHVILFGTFAAFALLGGRLVDRRKRREMGPEWQRMRNRVADAPRLPASLSDGTLLRLAAGVALYGTLLWAHPFLFGVSPLP
ncbi:NnrU family protein [Donghicola tyrosinivorans]|uniref:Putative membrane protein n=1 Tax=Donghicola tyrosinivorans TaxID=1652492 RepID=A0A2T0WAP5_9RHOB|nr:NnrU family protein [Donghicola tyrosinivorans]PRY83771.1 putative membrane protein [Donghicola tyrosinivorans]